jgi:SARP family transcriptional regulator, regulator of embCAB operon
VKIKVLGPLEAHENGTSIVPTAAKPRQILALLALQVGQVVPVPTLMEELWGEKPPRSALTTLQTYILQLRRNIGRVLADGRPTAKDILVTRYNGYLLDVSPDDIDSKRYERLAEAGCRAAELGDHAGASRLLERALSMWRGDALVDVQIGARLGLEVAWLRESRLGAVEMRIAAELKLGRHLALLSELASLTAIHPLNENLCAHFMLALYRSGRQSQALELFMKTRQALVDELGVEPSARLQNLLRAILNSDPGLDQPDADAALRQLAS